MAAEGKAITYDYERLSSTTYPNYTDNNITYTYGDPGANYNAAGRLTLLEDGSGAQAYRYGPLGEIVRNTRTVITLTGSGPSTYQTEYRYDTWNRLRELTYPDGEVLTHDYDSGGQLQSMQGEKGPYRYDYLKALTYDKFTGNPP